jgi:hypothetical protein
MQQPRDSKAFEDDKKNQRCILVDVDGTLADVRDGILQKADGEFDWENFYGLIPFYPTNEHIVRLTQMYYQFGFVVNIVTARPSRYKDKTKTWLKKHSIPYDYLFMREDGDMRKDEIVKKEILDREFENKSLIECVVDDRPSVVSMWIDNGLNVLAVNPHNFV